MPKQRGQPTKLTEEVQTKIIQAIRAGNHASVAAAYVGINESTFYNWMKWGQEQKSGLYVEFFKATKKAQAEAETRQVAIILKASEDTWQAAAWWLERKYPDRWGRIVQDVRMSGKVGVAPITADDLAQSERELEEFKRNADDSGGAS